MSNGIGDRLRPNFLPVKVRQTMLENMGSGDGGGVAFKITFASPNRIPWDVRAIIPPDASHREVIRALESAIRDINQNVIDFARY